MNRLSNIICFNAYKCCPEIYSYDTPRQRMLAKIPAIGLLISAIHLTRLFFNNYSLIQTYDLFEKKISWFSKIFNTENANQKTIIQRNQQRTSLNDTVIKTLKVTNRLNSCTTKESQNLQKNLFQESLRSTKEEIIKCNSIYGKTLENMKLLTYYVYAFEVSCWITTGGAMVAKVITSINLESTKLFLGTIVVLQICCACTCYLVTKTIQDESTFVSKKIITNYLTLSRIQNYARLGPTLDTPNDLIS